MHGQAKSALCGPPSYTRDGHAGQGTLAWSDHVEEEYFL